MKICERIYVRDTRSGRLKRWQDKVKNCAGQDLNGRRGCMGADETVRKDVVNHYTAIASGGDRKREK